jgi:hypothetical protein
MRDSLSNFNSPLRRSLSALPECLEDYVSAQHPVRFLEAFVEGLDLKACGFGRAIGVEPSRLNACNGSVTSKSQSFYTF